LSRPGDLGDEFHPDPYGARRARLAVLRTRRGTTLGRELRRELGVADLALRIGGGSGFLRTSPIQRHFRDAQAGALMAYSVEVCRDSVGKRVLG
jgi:alkylation response protein AidB-like acyl-CoA dehydrogenase